MCVPHRFDPVKLPLRTEFGSHNRTPLFKIEPVAHKASLLYPITTGLEVQELYVH